MAAAALRTAARHLAAPAALLAASQSSRCNEHDERLANLKAEVALLRGENARLRRALDGDRLDVEALRLRIAAFAKERDWDQFHTPRNILLAPVHKSTDTPSSSGASMAWRSRRIKFGFHTGWRSWAKWESWPSVFSGKAR